MKSIVFKILAVVITVAAVQLVIGRFHYPSELKTVMMGKECDASIVYLGDSTNRTYSHSDADRRPISAFLQDEMRKKVVTVSHNGYHLVIYKDFLGYLATHRAPEAVIIPINMCTFFPEGDAFQKESFLLNHGKLWFPLYKPVSVFTDFFKEEKTSPNQDVYDYDRFAGKIADFENDAFKTVTPERMRRKIIFRYRYKMKPNQSKLNALKQICQISKSKNIKVLMYITPIDLDYLDRTYQGTADIVKENVDIVKNVITANGLAVLDLSHALQSSYFSWPEEKYPNEHLNENGRKYVAHVLADAVLGRGDGNLSVHPASAAASLPLPSGNRQP